MPETIRLYLPSGREVVLIRRTPLRPWDSDGTPWAQQLRREVTDALTGARAHELGPLEEWSLVELQRDFLPGAAAWSLDGQPMDHQQVREDAPRRQTAVVGEPSWVALRLIGIWGHSYAGSQVRIIPAAGDSRRARLDDASRVRVEWDEPVKTCQVELDRGAKRSIRRPEDEGNTSAPRIVPGGPAVALATGQEHVLVVYERYSLSC